MINAKSEINSEENTTDTWTATGFPNNVRPYPSFAVRYIDDRPRFVSTIKRSANFLLSGNYVYNNKYLLDLVFRYDGTSVFGAAKKFTPFWALGTGWNIHNESFMRSIRSISRLRVRFTVGETGNQNISSTNSSSIYTYQLGGNTFGPGVFISSLGNPDVEWSKTQNYNLGLDLHMFDGRLMTEFNVFRKITSPMVVFVDQAPSVGARVYPMNMGNLTYQGIDFDIKYNIIRRRELSWRISFLGSSLKGRYDGFGDKLKSMDDIMQANNSLDRYRDGYSPESMWIVRSAGIDPTTGREVFLTRDGQPTFLYDANDAMYAGEERPVLQGNINTFVRYKNWSFMFAMSYAIQQKRLNEALFNKVENISMNEIGNNQDRRALYNRWQNPGDIAEFRSINLVSLEANAANNVPRMSSRYIQTENFFAGESLMVAYDFSGNWMKKATVQSLKLSLNVSGSSGFFRLSNVLLERGTSYPEATTFVLKIDATF
jgi:outer membrane receptor protein involved in Fe transport